MRYAKEDGWFVLPIEYDGNELITWIEVYFYEGESFDGYREAHPILAPLSERCEGHA